LLQTLLGFGLQDFSADDIVAALRSYFFSYTSA
jgi:hypothetical protein